MTSLVLYASLLVVGADNPPVIEDARTKEALGRFSFSVKSAAEDFDKRARRARTKLIGELTGAAAAASRTGNEAEARKIIALKRYHERLLERPVALPGLAANASTIVANSRWLLDIKQIYAFDASGKVTCVSSESGKRISEGRWEQVSGRGLKIRFGGFYVGVIDSDGKEMKIIGESSEWSAKRIN